jgi:serine/threonine protein phosphatase 1
MTTDKAMTPEAPMDSPRELDRHTFAVGDIHGRYDLLKLALAEIERRTEAARVVFLGDYIDRGPQSREVIETLMAGPVRSGDEWMCLKGNHEAMMLETIRAPLDPAWWCGNGGAATLVSFCQKVPSYVLDWCDSLPVSFERDHHFFVHAGIRPDAPLAKQHPEEVMWIREEFLGHGGPHPKHIVHGHTPRKTAELLPHRTNLDSGAFWTHRLSCGRFDLSQPGPCQELIVLESHR